MNEKELETSREDRRLIRAIAELQTLEAEIPKCATIDQVEEIRGRTMGIQSHDRNFHNVGEVIVAWAKRIAVKCQLRITEIQLEAKARRNGEVTKMVTSPPSTRTEMSRESERRAVVRNLPPEEIEAKLEQGSTVRQLAEEVRAAKRKVGHKPKSTPEQLAASRKRYYRAKEKAQIDKPPEPEYSTSEKFEKRYWPKEIKLLREIFSEKDFEKIEFYWTREFQRYRTEAEQRKQERANALANLKNKQHRPERLEPVMSEVQTQGENAI